MSRTAVLFLCLMAVAFPLSKAYDVVPHRDFIGTQIQGDVGVTQYYRNTLDSLTRISVWVGDTINPDSFKVEVRDSAVPTHRIAWRPGKKASQCWAWLDFDLLPDPVYKPIRGRTYAVKVTRPNGGAISYAYCDTNPYKYGCLVVGNDAHPTEDLALRVYGLHDPISDVWRACVNHGNDPFGDDGDTALAKAESMGVRWLRDDFLCMGTWENDTGAVMSIYHRYLDRGFDMVGILCYGSDDSTRSSGPPGASKWGSYPPRNLYESVNCDTNWWARYCWGIMGSMPNVKHWEVWPEANTPWFWRDPDIAYYWGSGGHTGDSIDTPRERCSLYVRMCQIAESVAQGVGVGQKVVGGATYRLRDGDDSQPLSPGVRWLQDMFDLAEHHYGGVENCFDIASAHAYMYSVDTLDPNRRIVWFDEDWFAKDLDTARWALRQAGYPGMELWATEYGWPRWVWFDTLHPKLYPVTDTLMQARDLCQFYTSAIARQGDPRGGYDRSFWYELTSYRADSNGRKATWGFGLVDTFSSQPRLPHSWAMQQVGEQLTGKRCNGRVMLGGTKDDSVRVYEFEDPATLKRTWVCWKNAGMGQGNISVELPATTDTLSGDDLDYDDGQYLAVMSAEDNGWLPTTLDERPVFITEDSDTSRPDLVVESLTVSPDVPHVHSWMDVRAYLKNVGNRFTPESTLVRFFCNDSLFASYWLTDSIVPGDTAQAVLVFYDVPQWMRGQSLFRAEVNPGQKFVEKNSLDDNGGYCRRTVTWAPTGDLRGVVCGGHSNAPLPLFALETHSLEADTLGTVPAESARLVQYWYGLNDTVVHGGDTTAWFCASETVSLDTSWLYLSEQGKYKMFLQVKDSWSMSDLIPDTTHPFVVFDTTGPTGSIVINGGARFAPSSTCTLALAAFDSASGVGWMRFMSRPRVDLVSNGGFLATAGSWGFTNGAYDTSLQMAALSAGAVQAKVRQFVPAESISAYSGDSCVLEASILAHVHDGDATGEVSFWFWSTREDTSQHDTLWELVDSASYSGDLLSLTGRYNLSTRFLLETPTPESGWVWRGGMVRVQAHGVDGGVGDVWTDNVALNAFEPQSGYAWWGTYDTLAEWDIGTGAGEHVVNALFLDSAGVENATPFADTIILDPTAPVVDIGVPDPGQLVSGIVEVTGWAYDPVEVAGDTWFKERRLSYRHADSANWLPVDPDSTSSQPCYPDSQSILGPAVHLGYWSTVSVTDGSYYLMLTGTDSAGHVSSCTTWVIVSNEGGGGGAAGGPEGGGTGMGEGSVYIGSSTGVVLHLSDDLDSLDCFQVTDSGSQACITAILEVGSDSLLVLDAYGKRIHKLHKGGQNRRRLVSNLSQPAGLTRDDNGNFWLVDKGIHRIGKFRSNGTLVFVRGGLGNDSLHFHSPEGISVKGGLVYVADTKNDRIAVWDTSGSYKATITGDFENPTAVFLTGHGSIYLTDGSDGKLKGITPLGGNIVAIGTADSSKLKGLVLSENRHYLFSIAAQPNKVHKLQIQSDESMPGGQQSAGKLNLPKILSLAQPFPNPARTRLHIAYALPRQTRVVLKLYDVAGKLVTTLANGEQKPGYYNLTWNRQDAKGRSCACGVYFCTLSAENKRFSRKVILTE